MEDSLLKNVKKCSRCAICAQACPIFLEMKNECTLSRGKLLQILGVLKGDLKFSSKIKRNINLCLNCSRCSNFCPSEIDMVKIFSDIRKEHLSFKDKILSGTFFHNLKFLPINIFKRRFREKEGEVHFFGCVSSYKNDFKCCGLPFLVEGRSDIADKFIEHNIKIIEKDDVKKVIFHCSSCFETVCKYPFKNQETLNKLSFEPDFKIPETSFTFHKPCHLTQDIFNEIENNLKKYKNYIPLKEQNCCGFGGDFFLRHPVLALKISLKKAREIRRTGAKKVVTVCPVCSWSLNIGRILSFIFKEQK